MTISNKWNTIVRVLFVVGLAAAVAGCKKKADAKGNEKAKKALTFKTIENAKLGFSVQVPEAAKELSCGPYNCTWSAPIDDMFEYNVSIAPVVGRFRGVSDAVREARMIGQKQLVEKKQLSGGQILIVKAPQGVLQDVWFYAKGRKGWIRAKCSAPKDRLADNKKICQSLKNTK